MSQNINRVGYWAKLGKLLSIVVSMGILTPSVFAQFDEDIENTLKLGGGIIKFDARYRFEDVDQDDSNPQFQTPLKQMTRYVYDWAI